ncbi:uncharacterized protein LOC123234317 [Gracilinanus agilis]|uniref:uncharacterized protein LOC123234317 n=1 Tax=Gracilinanus agilis TaxID=191870 RepID=UPI001CFEEDF6|nr:uncharacterized protein LOC123234317 [Gracilinanus agilis]
MGSNSALLSPIKFNDSNLVEELLPLPYCCMHAGDTKFHVVVQVQEERRQDLVPSQVLSGALSTAQFFLYEAFLNRHFKAVELEGNEPEPGDLFLFRLTSPTGRWLGAHVGVYCGHGEIIHFEGKPPPGVQAFLGPWEGMVSKQGRRQLLRSRSLWRVLRRKAGVDRKALKRRVQEAMDADELPYHPTHSNCVHFALTLLGQEIEPQGLNALNASNKVGSAS